MKVPNPTREIVSPFLSAFLTVSMTASTALPPSTLVRPAASDTAAINSALFIYLSRTESATAMHCECANQAPTRGGSETRSIRYPATAWTSCCHVGRGADFIPATIIRRNTRRGAALREFAYNRSGVEFDGISLDTMVRNLHARGCDTARCNSMRTRLRWSTVVAACRFQCGFCSIFHF